MLMKEFENFLIANKWAKIDDNNFMDNKLLVNIKGTKVSVIRKRDRKVAFEFKLGNSEIISEGTVQTHKGDRTYILPFSEVEYRSK